MSTHGVGAVVTLTTEVRDFADQLVDPAAITLTVLLPDGTTAGPFTAPQVVRDSAGAYHYDFATTVPGRHIARWVSTTPTGVDEESFDVAAMWAEAGVISLGEAKAQLNITGRDQDEELQGFVRAVTEVCERYAGALARTVHTQRVEGGRGIALNHFPILSVTSITAVWPGHVPPALADLDVDETTGVIQRKDGGRMCGPLIVTYLAGRPAIPPNVRLAALIILQHLWETQRGQVAPRFGADDTWDPRFGFAIPRRALELLGERVGGIA
ncbi:hypothetical protein Ssi03_76170 [Sphaerisporangium siamense]|uniref:Uncharacterized protein n=1 Tax=Sphaerisporangium siamense TaxID=795645 RepID=A0A7W7D331_9ACTN|nr:head-tail connector protein [Sphaerisporangium siamense]MBB4699297.1 hypothetical protein [Sphaerisporangium siamense]GII89627.1 hypothetical protein Ssi03_76170 [Sphaerisporangium siamense]